MLFMRKMAFTNQTAVSAPGPGPLGGAGRASAGVQTLADSTGATIDGITVDSSDVMLCNSDPGQPSILSPSLCSIYTGLLSSSL